MPRAVLDALSDALGFSGAIVYKIEERGIDVHMAPLHR
jgi:hypothetical protein